MVFRNNVAAHNIANGFRVHASQNVYVGNRAISNGEWGFVFNVGDQFLIRNAVIANHVDGIFVAPGTTQVVVEKTNFYGNGLAEAFQLNCGLRAGSGAVVEATNNFWGASSGPGADPADAVCATGNVTFEPFAPREFKLPEASD